MRIDRVKPLPPPVEFSLTFSRDEGWAIAHALRDYAENYPDAANVDEYQKWAKDLDAELRRGL